jgi:hypothetical protein
VHTLPSLESSCTPFATQQSHGGGGTGGDGGGFGGAGGGFGGAGGGFGGGPGGGDGDGFVSRSIVILVLAECPALVPVVVISFELPMAKIMS